MLKELLKAIAQTIALAVFARIQRKLGDNRPKPIFDSVELPWLGLPRTKHNTTEKYHYDPSGQDIDPANPLGTK